MKDGIALRQIQRFPVVLARWLSLVLSLAHPILGEAAKETHMQVRRSCRRRLNGLLLAIGCGILLGATVSRVDAVRVVATFSGEVVDPVPIDIPGIQRGVPVSGSLFYETDGLTRTQSGPGIVAYFPGEFETTIQSQLAVRIAGTTLVTNQVSGETVVVVDFVAGTADDRPGSGSADDLIVVAGRNSQCRIGEVERGCGIKIDLKLNNSVLTNTSLPTSLVFSPNDIDYANSFGYINLDDGRNITFSLPSFSGIDASNPILPEPNPDGGWTFPPIPVTEISATCCWDPPVTVGYDFALDQNSPDFYGVTLPILGDFSYRLHLFDGSPDVRVPGGEEYIFPAGIRRFQVLDIPESLGIDPTNTQAFVVALAFARAGIASLTMTPLTTESAVTVSIDIKPGIFPNWINPCSTGKTPVAILTTPTFDATRVDSTTVRFGATGTEAPPTKFFLQDIRRGHGP